MIYQLITTSPKYEQFWRQLHTYIKQLINKNKNMYKRFRKKNLYFEKQQHDSISAIKHIFGAINKNGVFV